MGQASSIEWTDATWNPVRGCSRVSPGCGGAAGEGGCYAERQAARFCGPGQPYEGLIRVGKQGPRWTGDVRLVVEHLGDPLRWKKPRRVFVNSMSDLFHEGLTNKEIASVFGVMAAAPQHTFQVLTKRAQRMRRWFEWVASIEEEHGPPPDVVVSTCAANYIDCDQLQRPWPLPNVWIGVSAEDQARADERITHLLSVPAAVRFVSYEPALERLNLTCIPDNVADGKGDMVNALTGEQYCMDPGDSPDLPRVKRLDWVIVGGESGPGARPFAIEWAVDVVRQCRDADVPVFMKQYGDRPTFAGEPIKLRTRKGADLSELRGDWPREFPR